MCKLNDFNDFIKSFMIKSSFGKWTKTRNDGEDL